MVKAVITARANVNTKANAQATTLSRKPVKLWVRRSERDLWRSQSWPQAKAMAKAVVIKAKVKAKIIVGANTNTRPNAQASSNAQTVK